MKLTPEARDAMLAEYAAGEKTLRSLARKWGVSKATIQAYRKEAGLSGRAATPEQRKGDDGRS